MSRNGLRLVILTGPPGCGKTTLVKNVCEALKTNNFSLVGFFTEEIRSGKERIGFDVVLLNGKRAPLARIKSGSCTKPMVGKYTVEITSFESCIMPIFSSVDETSVLVLDEVGKMELLSEKFKAEVNKCMNRQDGVILATIPFNTRSPIQLVEKIKAHPNTCLITVDKNNRDLLVDKITNLIMNNKMDFTASV